MSTRLSSCPGCGAELPHLDGPTHAYLGASAACWARFGELLAREYGELDYPDVHRVTVDAYAVQHPGVPERRTIKSLGVHLVALCLVFDHRLEPPRVTQLMNGISAGLSLRWLDPPRPNGRIVVADLVATDPSEHEERIMNWARDVWTAWAPHHPTVRSWAQVALDRA